MLSCGYQTHEKPTKQASRDVPVSAMVLSQPLRAAKTQLCDPNVGPPDPKCLSHWWQGWISSNFALASMLAPGKVPAGLKIAAGMHNAHDAF